MLRNDVVFWGPRSDHNAALLSWGGSDGDFETLWNHTQKRWGWITDALSIAGAPTPTGRVIEFGSGMGLLDDVLDASTTSLVMLDHTDGYIAQRPHPLSARCRHLLWGPETLDELQRTEAGSFDWAMSIAVFYHLDTATAAALIRELAVLLAPGGHVLVEGWNPATPEQVRALSSRDRLFSMYPNYPLDVDLLSAALAPELEERCRNGVLLYRKH
ncbi:MAG: class I SAM-dependent methyltransferase [Acidimicrobiia bacterium]|nr:class I SAM-dependent methyltransferase [Acidimicrobiia bacterium]